MSTKRNSAVAALAVLLMIAPPVTVGAHGHAADDVEAKALELRVTPRALQSPGTIRVTATIERNSDNRKVTIEAESNAFFRSSSATLEGADAARTYTRVFSGLPPGSYEVRVTVERNDGTELLDVVMVEVFGQR